MIDYKMVPSLAGPSRIRGCFDDFVGGHLLPAPSIPQLSLCGVKRCCGHATDSFFLSRTRVVHNVLVWGVKQCCCWRFQTLTRQCYKSYILFAVSKRFCGQAILRFFVKSSPCAPQCCGNTTTTSFCHNLTYAEDDVVM